jgi:hypothetical protein
MQKEITWTLATHPSGQLIECPVISCRIRTTEQGHVLLGVAFHSRVEDVGKKADVLSLAIELDMARQMIAGLTEVVSAQEEKAKAKARN